MNSLNKKNNRCKTIGKHRLYTNCRFCSEKLLPVIHLGTVPLAGGFIEKKGLKDLDENFFPLTLGLCEGCKMLQTLEVIDPKILFENYYYSSSKIGTLINHFEMLAEEITKSLSLKRNGFVIEIGSNDGVLVKSLLNKNVNILGIDPAKNIVSKQIAKGYPLLCGFFNEELAKNIVKKYGKADIITSSNTMAHIENISSAYKGIKKLLKKSGYGIVEVHYLTRLLEEFQYDMIYHEHLYYYSVTSMLLILELFGLELFDAIEIPIHAGSIRFYIQHTNGPRPKSQNIKRLLSHERKLGVNKIDTYLAFNNEMRNQKKSLVELLTKLRKKAKSIAGYGASGRGNTIMSYSQIDNSLLDYVIDDSPLKQGRYTPGNHLAITDSKVMNTTKHPDYTLLFAWSFYEEIIKRNPKYIELGGKFIIPMPHVKILP